MQSKTTYIGFKMMYHYCKYLYLFKKVMAEEATKRTVGLKSGKSRKALILGLCYIYKI